MTFAFIKIKGKYNIDLTALTILEWNKIMDIQDHVEEEKAVLKRKYIWQYLDIISKNTIITSNAANIPWLFISAPFYDTDVMILKYRKPFHNNNWPYSRFMILSLRRMFQTGNETF